MTTIWRIATREWTDWLRDRRRTAVAAAVALVAVMAGVTGATGAGARAEAAAAAQRADYARWLAQPERGAHSASHFGLSVFHVPSRLAVFDPGVGAYAGSALFLEAHRQNEPVFTEAADRGAAPRFGELSLATVVQVWIPLLIILLGAGCIAGEREGGILPQLLAAGVAPWQMALGKAVAIAAATGVVAAPGVVAVVFAGVMAEGIWPPDTGWRLSLLASAVAAYVLFWVAVTVAVSARARSWRVATALLAILWCATVVVAPRLASDVARERHPLPSRAEQDRLELEARILGPGGADRRREAILAEHGVASPADLPVDISVLIAQRAEAAINARIDARIQASADVLADERRDYLRAAWLTPAIAMDVASAGAAGSDDVQHREFLEHAEMYRRQMMDVLTDADVRRPGERARRADAEVWTRLPMFAPAMSNLRDTSSRAGTAAAALALWCVAGCVAAAWAVRRVGARS